MIGNVWIALVETAFEFLELRVDVVGASRTPSLEILHSLWIADDASVVNGDAEPLAENNGISWISDRRTRMVAVAIDEDNPDLMLFAARNRLYLSENGGIFWRALVPELPEIEAVTFVA